MVDYMVDYTEVCKSTLKILNDMYSDTDDVKFSISEEWHGLNSISVYLMDTKRKIRFMIGRNYCMVNYCGNIIAERISKELSRISLDYSHGTDSMIIL